MPLRVLLLSMMGLAVFLAGPLPVRGQIVKGTNYRVVALGDSITNGSGGGFGGYRQKLQALLTAGGYSCTFIGSQDSVDPGTESFTVPTNGASLGMSDPNHEGYRNLRIDQIDNGGTFQNNTAPPIQTTLANYPSDVILLMIGTNDALQDYDETVGPGYDGETGFAANAGQRLNVLLGHIFAAEPNVLLVLAQITDLRTPSQDARVVAYNAYVARVYAQYKSAGCHIVLCNQQGAFDIVAESADGIHPTTSGYEKLAVNWYAALTGQPAPVPAVQTGPALSFASAKYVADTTHYSLGYTFTTGAAPLTVSALGYNNDGINGTHLVQIYKVTQEPDANGAGTGTAVPGASAAVTTVGGGSTSNTTFTYASIAPVTLDPGTEYEVVATSNGDGFSANAVSTLYNGVTYGHAVYRSGTDTADFGAYAATANDVGSLGPNFLLSVPVTTGPALGYFESAYKDDATHYSLGYTFTTGIDPVTVTALGYVNDGFDGTHQVQIYRVNSDPVNGSGAGTPVDGASASVTTSGGSPGAAFRDQSAAYLSGSFTYVDIPSVTLDANTLYEITANNNGDGFGYGVQVPRINGIVYGHATHQSGVDTAEFGASVDLANGVGNIGPGFVVAPYSTATPTPTPTPTPTVTPTPSPSVSPTASPTVSPSPSVSPTIPPTPTPATPTPTPPVPVVTVVASVPVAHLGSGVPGVFTFSVPTAPTAKIVVHYVLTGSAVNGKDYVLLTGKAKIKPGKTVSNVQVVPGGDLGGASSKKVKLIVQPGTGYTIGTSGPVKIKIHST